MARTLGKLKASLQSSQKSAASRQEQRDKYKKDYDTLLVGLETPFQQVTDLEQQMSAASHRRPHSPARESANDFG